MAVWIALFRGINVGGNNIVPMKELRTLLTKLGYGDVQTYIQSGNAVFSCPEADKDVLADQIKTKMGATFGFEPDIMVLPAAQLKAALEQNPFPEAVADPKTLHLLFLADMPPSSDLGIFTQWQKASEQIALKGQVFYLYAPEGIGRSKLAARAERLLAVRATGRNLRSAQKILVLAEAVHA